jgi:hypothetical protein
MQTARRREGARSVELSARALQPASKAGPPLSAPTLRAPLQAFHARRASNGGAVRYQPRLAPLCWSFGGQRPQLSMQ